jgi:hypothetical protein
VSSFWGKSHWGAFGGPKRFCDEKVGPQRSQSAPQNDKWTQISEKLAKKELKIAPKKAPRVKKNFKSGIFRNQKRILKTELKPLEKTQKINSNKSSKSKKSYSIQSRPGGLREALTIKSTVAGSARSALR